MYAIGAYEGHNLLCLHIIGNFASRFDTTTVISKKKNKKIKTHRHLTLILIADIGFLCQQYYIHR